MGWSCGSKAGQKVGVGLAGMAREWRAYWYIAAAAAAAPLDVVPGFAALLPGNHFYDVRCDVTTMPLPDKQLCSSNNPKNNATF